MLNSLITSQSYNNNYNQEYNVDNFIDNKNNEYLLAKNKILVSNLNKGEKDEVITLIELFYLNQINDTIKLINIFGEEASEGIRFIDMNTNDEIFDINKLSKAKVNFKADCMIQMKKTNYIYCISIKSKNGSKPSILNHTPRSANVFKKHGILFDYIYSLDTIIAEYKHKRIKKIIKEDTLLTNLESLNNPIIKNDFLNVLSYFMFDGTGKGYSKCKANAIIIYENNKINFIKCVNIEQKSYYIRKMYDKIILSLRDKGMPKKITEYNKPWIFNQTKANAVIKYKGSLHIRIK